MQVLFLGLVTWIATTIVVESELFRPLRAWIGMRGVARKLDRDTRRLREDGSSRLWAKAAYLVECPLCTGTWIGLVLAFTFGSPFPGLPGTIAGGLLYKAIAHLVLELRPQAWFTTSGAVTFKEVEDGYKRGWD